MSKVLFNSLDLSLLMTAPLTSMELDPTLHFKLARPMWEGSAKLILKLITAEAELRNWSSRWSQSGRPKLFKHYFVLSPE